MTEADRIQRFLAGAPHAVVGASQRRSKYGNKVLRAYVQNDRPVFPVHPAVDTIEGLQAYPDLESLPEPVHGISIITPPAVTERIVEQAGLLGIQHLWMQPGAESDLAVQRAEQLGMNLVAGGACLLVVLRYSE